MAQTEFKIPLEIARTPGARWAMKRFFESIRDQVGLYGANGEKVGLGFIWYTNTGMADRGFPGVAKVARSLLRCAIASGIISPRAITYLLECRIDFIREGEPHAVVTLKED